MSNDKPDYTLGGILKKILISRGAPKEKYSQEVPLIRLIWWPQKFPPLSPKEQNIIADIKESFMYLKNYDRLNRKEDKLLRKQLLEDISKAVRGGLIWHPLVSGFFYTHKALGSKDVLRAIKRGWETEVKRPIQMKDVNFKIYLDDIVEYRYAGKTWPQIRRDLMKRKIIGKMSWQGLQKKVKKAWEEKWAKFGKKAPAIP